MTLNWFLQNTWKDNAMRKFRSLFSKILIGTFTLMGFACSPGPEEEAKQEGLLLRDFKPISRLHVPVHHVSKARFPAIDIHNHINDPRDLFEKHMPVTDIVRVMEETNVRMIVILTGLWGDRLQRVIDEMVTPYPDRFKVFTQLDWSKVDEADFGQQMAAQIRDSVRRGARGLKILKSLGLTVRDKSGKLIPVDDSRLEPVWAECGRLGIPVPIHVTDPEAFFYPVGPDNERIGELGDHPEWSFSGPEFPSKEEIMEARNRVFGKHPNTTFISLHVGNWPENLDYVSATLDRYPNMVVELGERQADLGRQPRRARKFFLEYQDRILFGTDRPPREAMYHSYFRWLETRDEYFEYWTWPRQGRWRIFGLDLPDSVLENIYHFNAEKIFRQFKGLPPA